MGKTATKTPAEMLIELKGTQSAPALDALVERYFTMVYSTCLRITRDRHDAEDASQAAFLCLARQLHERKDIRAVGPWLYQVACNASVDICRRRKRRATHEPLGAKPEAIGVADDPACRADLAEVRPAVLEQLNKLPTRYRLPLILHYFGGLSQEQLAKELACTRGTLRVRLHRGHKLLRKALEKRGICLAGGLLGAILADAVRSQVSDGMVSATIALGRQVSDWGMQACIASPDVLAASQVAAPAAARPMRFWIVVSLAAASILTASAPLLAKLKDLPNWPMPLDLAPIRLPELSAPLPKLSDAQQPATPERTQRPGIEQTPSETAKPKAAPAVAAAPLPQQTTSGERPVASPAAQLSSPAPAGPATYRSQTAPTYAVRLENPATPISNTNAFPATTSRALPDATSRRSSRSSATRHDRVAEPDRDPPGPPLPPVDPPSPPVHLPPPVQPPLPPVVPPTPERPIAIAATFSSATASPWHDQLASSPPTNLQVDFATADGVAGTVLFASAPGGPPFVTLTSTNGLNVRFLGSHSISSFLDQAMLYTTSNIRHDTVPTISPLQILRNNGQVIADGRQESYRWCDGIQNDIDNPRGGFNGWFAMNGGRLSLPATSIQQGTHSYNWGEDASDTTPDLINSLRLTATASADSTLDIALIATDTLSVPQFPAGHHFISVYELAGGQTITGPMATLIRYDDARLTYLGLDESQVKLWYYTDPATGWQRAYDGFGRDTENDWVSADIPAGVHYIAVSTPEPASLALLGTGAFLLLRRRRA